MHFKNVVLPPYSHSDIEKKSAWREFAGVKLHVFSQLFGFIKKYFCLGRLFKVYLSGIYIQGKGYINQV